LGVSITTLPVEKPLECRFTGGKQCFAVKPAVTFVEERIDLAVRIGDLLMRLSRPDEAEQQYQLDEAGWRKGADGIRAKDGVQLKFTCSTTAGNTARQNTQQLFQQNWKKIGVEMEIKNMPASVVWGEYTIKSQFDTLLVAWEPTVGMDPDYAARCHSKLIPAKHGSGSNYVQYENPELDALLDLGVTQTSQQDRIATYHKIQEILLRDVPFAPQGAVQQGFMRHTAMTGIRMNQYVVDNTWNVQEWGWS
jgi:peptide/nickel transport system substrate-binding protein